MKKNCLIYANCQGAAIGHFLNKSEQFRETYEIKYIENYKLIDSSTPVPLNEFKDTDLLIYQPLGEMHTGYTFKELAPVLKDSCQTISFPYIFNNALWPLIKEGEKIIGDNIIIDLLAKGLSPRKITKMFLNLEIDFDLKNRFSNSLSILQKKEALCDIKISHFIIDNLRTNKLFLTQNHPTSILLLHCVNQILNLLTFYPLKKESSDHPNEASMPGCWPSSPYDQKIYKFSYNYHWSVFHDSRNDDNWRIFYLKLIREILCKEMAGKKWPLILAKMHINIRRGIYKLLP